MSTDVEARLAYLENRLAIQDLRHRYWLAVVEKDHAAMVACYAEDAHSEFGFGFDLRGRAAISDFYATQFANEALEVQVPLGTNGLIEFTEAGRATGSWLISVSVVPKGATEAVRNAVRYHERYVIEDGRWKIAYQKTVYLFWETIRVREGLAG